MGHGPVIRTIALPRPQSTDPSTPRSNWGKERPVLKDLETEVHLSLLPLLRDDGSTDGDNSESGETSANGSELPRLRVMIADDVPSTRRFLRAVLEHCRQFDVVGEAGDGDASIELAETVQPDLVLLDLSMPRVDGASALNGIRRVAPNARVIVVSGMNPAVGLPIAETGAVAFVPKGIPPFELLDRLGSILERPLTVECRESWEAILTEHRAVVCANKAATRHLVTQVLERCGVIVTAETDTASTMLQLVDSAQPEIVVIDLPMKGVADTTVISEICRRSPRSAVVVYSAFETLKEEALAAGATEFVAEPHVDELAERIEHLIR